ncbi:hypothetical protein C8Q72DRAFT_627144 [Fomitopsis betulina]|nr:hypothetical protein C8Q72DRAFT_627144 [Fomitopsis betulina]
MSNWDGQQGGDVQRFDNAANGAFDQGVQDVVDAPDNAAQFAGDQTGDAVHDVDDIGRDLVDGVKDVAGFGRGVDNSYDQGVQQGEQQGGW